MELKNLFKILNILIFCLVLSILGFKSVNAQCTTSNPSGQCCWGACAPGWEEVSQNALGSVRCCGSARASCGIPANNGTCAGVNDLDDTNCLKDHCVPVSYFPTCGNCVWCREECNCDCSCPTPACPPGTVGNNTGDACRVGPVNSLCQGTCNQNYCPTPSCASAGRTCWIAENNPIPGSPTSIDMKVERRDGTQGSDRLQSTAYRVSYPRDGKLYDFRAAGPPNNPRSNDLYNGSTAQSFSWQTPFSTCNSSPSCSSIFLQGNFPQAYGQPPALSYRYSFNGGAWSSLQGTGKWFGPNVTLVQGQTYTIRAQTYSANRCLGHRAGGSYNASFKVNHKPQVLSIVPIANPNGSIWGDNPNMGVSGNPAYDASQFSMPNSADSASDPFNCTIDNPKFFKVTFEDKDGCADIDPSAAVPNNTLAGFRTPRQLGIRAVDKSGSSPDVNGSSPVSVNCVGGNRLEVVFNISFTGSQNRNYEIQAAARDVLGNRTYKGSNASPWIKGLDWSYDASPPGSLADPLSIEVKKITGAAELLLSWEARDHRNDLSGVRFVRTYASLAEGFILTDIDDYGSIIYDVGGANKVVNVTNPFKRFHVLANELSLTAQQARNLRANTHSGEKLLNIGINHDGFFTFNVVAVDRACNYGLNEVEQTLGTPWIATRGGFVFSREGIRLNTNIVNYKNIKTPHPSLEPAEETSLSTEWLASGGTVNPDLYAYLSEGYSSGINSGLYSKFKEIAQRRDPDKEMWDVLSGADLVSGHIDSDTLLENCRDDSRIYFVDSNLKVNPLHYQNLGVSPGKGCVFIVNGNIDIGSGEYKSAGQDSPRYDLMRGFFISEGEINVEFVDEGEDVRDGLKVTGSLIGLGNVGGNSSVRLRRSLQLRDNLLHPTLIIFHDPRYMDIARHVLGETIGGGYIRDVGFVE